MLRSKQSQLVVLPGTRWVTTDVVSRTLVDEYNVLMGSSGLVGQNSAPSVAVHITAFGLSTATMADRRFPLPLQGMVHLQHRVCHMSDGPIDRPLRLSTWAQNRDPHRARTSVEVWAQLVDPNTDKLLWQSMALHPSKSPVLPGATPRPRPERPAFQPP